MRQGIAIAKTWSDDDIVELRIVVADDASSFSNTAYVGHGQLQELIQQLGVFRNHVHGGISDIQFGAFGPEYANGALLARLHFRSPGRLFVSTHQQSEFNHFSVGPVASEARMYLVSEPILLDDFITELGGLAAGARDDAFLACPIQLEPR